MPEPIYEGRARPIQPRWSSRLSLSSLHRLSQSPSKPPLYPTKTLARLALGILPSGARGSECRGARRLANPLVADLSRRSAAHESFMCWLVGDSRRRVVGVHGRLEEVIWRSAMPSI
uniref:Uncharacterized protein n=1 Tax=Setaria viridis TaxID=4556 RepID=A0A4U6V081_SETVI|nr:hypothetical protein SEVIR_4G099400v2 [Setaria viridis]TKW20596.1 hypothetical protein SEVIR_4G099400v2 [Setaria viridis]